MFDIYTQNVAGAASDLQQITRKWGYGISDVYRVEGVLRGFSGMEQVLAQLSRVRGKLEEQQQMLSILTQATEKIAGRYLSSENRVINNAEGSYGKRLHPNLHSGVNIFSTDSDFETLNVKLG